MVHIEPTNVCNIDCVMCPRREMDRPLGFMKWELFQAMVDEMSQLRTELIYLHLFGEPTLHPDIGRMISCCKERGIDVAMSTNATKLDAAMSHRLIEAGLDNIIISFDGGGDPEKYAYFRKGAQFEEVIENILGFLKEKKGGAPFTIIQTISMKGNEDAASKLHEIFKGFPVVINDKPYDEWGGKVERIVNLSTAGRSCGYSGRRLCEKIWRLMVIHYDGRVVPCSKFYGSDFDLGFFPQQSLKEIWNGEKMRAFRERHLLGRDNIAYCSTCCYEGPSKLEQAGLTALDALCVERLIHEMDGWRK